MRKGLLCFLVIIAGMAGLVRAQESAQARFDQANTFFNEGELTEAMNLYRQIESSGNVSGALYLNMGIVAVQLDSMGLAKYYFIKSSDFAETEDRAHEALEYVQSQFSRQSATLPKLPWDRAVEWMNEGPGSSSVFITGFIFSLSGLIILYLYWFNLISFRNLKWYAAGIIATGTLIALLSFYVDYVDQRYNQGILIDEESRVMQSPQEDGNLVSLAYEGYNLTVDEWQSQNKEGWLYVRLGNGQYGWIKDQGIKKIKD